MSKERGPFHKYVKYVEEDKRKWECNFCGLMYCGNTRRIRAHLAGKSGLGIKVCEKVTDPVRAEALKTFEGQGRGLDKSTEGTSGKGMEGTVFGASQSVLPSEGASNPNGTQNLNQHGCAPQQPSCDWLTGTGTASACPQDDNASNPNHTQNSNQLVCTLQQPSFDQPTGTGTAPACSQDQVPLPLGDMPLDNLDNTQQSDPLNHWSDSSHGNESASTLRQLAIDCSATFSLDDSELLLGHPGGDVLPTPLLSNITMTRIPQFSNEQYLSFEEQFAGGITRGTLPDSTGNFNIENLLIDFVEGANACEERETGELHYPTPMDLDPSTASQQLEASTNTIGQSSAHASVPPQLQIVPHGSINLTTVHQNPTLPSSSSKNNLVTCHPQALMDKDSCMPSASQAPNNAPPPPQILPCGTGLIGTSSIPELDMNGGAPTTSHLNIGNNSEENIALKRKLELLYSKEAGIRNALEFAASPSPKKPRMEFVNWLANVEKLRNDYPEAASEDCLPLHQWVDTLMHEAKDLMRLDKGLFEARETKVGKLLENKMVGEAFRSNTTEILEFLVGNQISRLGICGMGGVGKTTIMMHIHNRLLEVANYGNVLWIIVSQDLDTERLQDAIWKKLGSGILEEKDVRKRAATLYDCLMKRGKSTIILDDVWERLDLKEIGIPIESNGIKLVLTTRSLEVCRQMQCQKMIKIEPLSHIEAKSLFFEELGSEVALNLETKELVMSVIKECAGLPLAIITLARSMRGVTNVFEWKDCLEKLRESDMEQQMDMEKVINILKFSYNRLRYHEYQQCFLSCALYPEDWLIDKFVLIEFFIDQGLFGQLNTREKQYDRGLTILQKLVNACLLEDHEGEIKMHDLIRGMALQIMRVTAIVKARKGLRRIPSEEYWTDALEKVSLMENYIEEFPSNMSPNCPKLSTFLLNENFCRVFVIPDSFFKHLLGLKCLDLSRSRLWKLPNSISDLVNLTALLLGECSLLCSIPHLGKLKSLRKLDIHCCGKVKALEGLDMLVNLRYLDINATHIERLPKGTLGAFSDMQCLGAGLVNGEEITKLWALEALVCFFDNVDDFNKFVRVVSKRRNNPCYYEISVHQERATYEPTSVDVIFQDRKRSVNIVMRSDAIASVREASSSSGGGSGSGSGICILIPQDVQNLIASDCDGMTNLSDLGQLENLEVLDISCWNNLQVLYGAQDEELIDFHYSPTRNPTPLLFGCLRDLEICDCPKLKYLFGHGPKFYLPCLQRIDIRACEEMVGIIAAASSPPPYPPPAFPILECIEVWMCDKMKRVVESEWLPHFPNLRELKVNNSKNMEQIIGMAEMIRGVGQGQEGSMTTPVNNTPSSSQSSISLPKLNSLCLHSLPQLKSICEVPITCNSMKFLSVMQCPELNRIPLKLQLRDIEDLPYIELEGEEKWKTLICDHPDAHVNLQSHLLFEGSHCILKGRRNS